MEGIQGWLKRNGCNFNANGDTPMTHTIMKGGTLFIPEDLYDEFLGVYGREIEAKDEKLTYSERPSSPTFRMYFDIDLLDGKELDDGEVLEIVREVQSTTAIFFAGAPDETLKCVVSRTQSKEVEVKTSVVPVEAVTASGEPAPPRMAKKNGIHLNFPKLMVNLEMALQIRYSVVLRLEKRFGPRPLAQNPWADVIDKAPYFSGLKMIGSVKRAHCNLCNSSKKKKGAKDDTEEQISDIIREIVKVRKKLFNRLDDTFDYSNIMNFAGDEYRNQQLAKLNARYHAIFRMCLQCDNKGWYLENRSYSPSHVLGAGGAPCLEDLEHIRRDFHEQMRWTSIRARSCDQPEPSYSVPRGHQAPPQDCASTSLTAFGSAGLEYISPGLYREIIQSDVHAEDVRGQSKWRGAVIKDPEAMALITKCVRDVNDRYRNIVVREAMEIKTAKKADSTGTMITSGAGAGMIINKKTVRETENIITKMANANNTTIANDTVLKVYTTIVVRVTGEGSRYCQNKGDEHTSNSVYFCISNKGVTQMCHSGKDTLGNSGKTCRKYHSTPKDTTIALRKKLFPGDFGLDMNEVNSQMNKRAGEKTVTVTKKLKKGTKTAMLRWNTVS